MPPTGEDTGAECMYPMTLSFFRSPWQRHKLDIVENTLPAFYCWCRSLAFTSVEIVLIKRRCPVKKDFIFGE